MQNRYQIELFLSQLCYVTYFKYLQIYLSKIDSEILTSTNNFQFP